MNKSKSNFISNNKHYLSELYPATLITLFSISFWSIFVLFFRPLYKWSILWFRIESQSNFSRDKILSNYNALIDYFFPWVQGYLLLPSLPQSTHGIQHFAEVKEIFNLMILIAPITLLLFVFYLIRKHNKHNLHFLKFASIMLVIAPFILSTGFIIDFDKTFTLFHRIFFQNDYWLFDSSKDPIILILPKQFFMLCAMIIIAFQFLTALFCYLLYKIKNKA